MPGSLSAYKFDDRFSAFDSRLNPRQRLQYLRDQGPIADIADPDPYDGGAILVRGAQESKVSVFCDQGRRTRDRLIPNLLIARRGHTEIGHVYRLTAHPTQSVNERDRQLGIDEEQQSYSAAMIGWSAWRAANARTASISAFSR